MFATRWLQGACVLAVMYAAFRAHAEPPSAGGPHRIEWNHPRFRPAEATFTAGVLLTAMYVELKEPEFSPDSGWHEGVLFDDAVRDVFRIRSRAGREHAARWSDYLWHPTQYFPVVVDGWIAPLLFDRMNTDVALQMTLVNWEAQTVALFLVRFGHHAIGRGRPSIQGCKDDPAYDKQTCDPNDENRNASIPAGHTAMAFAGAALTCAHHAALPVYGSDWGGKLACALTLASATTVAVLRVVSENHWATDSLLGIGIGVGAGLGVPYLLHYGPHLRGRHGFVTMLPWTSPRAGGITIAAMH